MVAVRDLEIRHLQALDAVAATGTFGRAAHRLGYTQSAVSQQIAALERAVGQPLFDRPGGPRPAELTPVGRLLVEHAREVLERVEVAAASIERFQAGAAGRIEIGTFQSVSTSLLPAVLDRLRTGHPDLEARLTQSHEEEYLARLVSEGQLDVSFLLGIEVAELEHIELFVDPYVVVTPVSASASTDVIDVGQLDGTALIGEQDSMCQRSIDRGLRACGVEPDYVFRTNDNAAIIAMVRAGMGMAVMPLLAAEQDHAGVAIHPLEPPIAPRRVTLAWRRGRTLSPCAERFIALATEMTAPLRGTS